jgi:hypothetical protein
MTQSLLYFHLNWLLFQITNYKIRKKVSHRTNILRSKSALKSWQKLLVLKSIIKNRRNPTFWARMFLKECRISKTNLPSKKRKKNYKIKNQNKIFMFFKIMIALIDRHLLKICLQFLIENTVIMLIIISRLICLLPA